MKKLYSSISSYTREAMWLLFRLVEAIPFDDSRIQPFHLSGHGPVPFQLDNCM